MTIRLCRAQASVALGGGVGGSYCSPCSFSSSSSSPSSSSSSIFGVMLIWDDGGWCWAVG